MDCWLLSGKVLCSRLQVHIQADYDTWKKYLHIMYSGSRHMYIYMYIHFFIVTLSELISPPPRQMYLLMLSHYVTLVMAYKEERLQTTTCKKKKSHFFNPYFKALV